MHFPGACYQLPRMLVVASAEAGVDHQLLFTTAAPHLARNVKHMSGRDAVDVLLGEVSRQFEVEHSGRLTFSIFNFQACESVLVPIQEKRLTDPGSQVRSERLGCPGTSWQHPRPMAKAHQSPPTRAPSFDVDRGDDGEKRVPQ